MKIMGHTLSWKINKCRVCPLMNKCVLMWAKMLE